MGVILIEVNGADFKLVNSNHHGAFNHEVIEAATWIEQRLSVILRNLESFGGQVHRIRSRAGKGASLHNAFLGPHHRLPIRIEVWDTWLKRLQRA